MVALTQVFAGDSESGLISIEKAIERNPDHPFNYLYTKGVALFNLEKFDAAADLFEAALQRNPGFIPARLAYVSTLSHLGRVDEAAWELEEVLVRQPEFSLLREQVRAPYASINDTLRYIRGLKAAIEN
jgi:tetratricopeptide (TPR) repeat protein